MRGVLQYNGNKIPKFVGSLPQPEEDLNEDVGASENNIQTGMNMDPHAQEGRVTMDKEEDERNRDMKVVT